LNNKTILQVRLNYIALLISAVIQTFASCSPWSGETRGWLQIVCLAVLCAILSTHKEDGSKRRVQQCFKYGLVFSSAWLCSTFWWIYVSLHTYGGLPSVLTVIAVGVLGTGLGLYYALACAVYGALKHQLSILERSVLMAALWTCAELARGEWFTGFPWEAVGYAHLDNPLKFLAPIIGVYGVGAVAVFISTLLAHFCTEHVNRYEIKLKAPLKVKSQDSLNLDQFEDIQVISNQHQHLDRIGWLFVLVGVLALAINKQSIVQTVESYERSADQLTPKMTFRLLQGNIGQDVKYGPSGLSALEWYKSEILSANVDLVVTPETALPVLKPGLPKHYWQDLMDHYATDPYKDKGLLIGLVGELGDGYTNAVEGIGHRGEEFAYSKHHLVPFGEFIPPWFKWFTDMMHIPLGSFTRGELKQASWHLGEQLIAVNICYEDVFGEEIASSFDPEATLQPTLMVNVSNIGWFGPYLAVEQHLNASRMRALEMHRPMLRATNTGATALVDPFGYVKLSLPKYEQGVLQGEVQGVVGPPTLYARWSARYGLSPLWLVCMSWIALCIGLVYKRKTMQ
jgi:apolipoprotein N-acyltransferase